jgi:hypothetical protein
MGNSTQKSTDEYIREHRNRVQEKLLKIVRELYNRAEAHDKSKLEDPEYTGWRQMDKEPRYKYGTPEYFAKMRKYQWVFDEHYKKNRHHPEYWQGFFHEMDLVDFLEMIIDWCSYKEDIHAEEMIEIVTENCERFHFPPLLKDLAINTLKNYIVEMSDEWSDLGIKKPDIDEIDWSDWYN